MCRYWVTYFTLFLKRFLKFFISTFFSQFQQQQKKWVLIVMKPTGLMKLLPQGMWQINARARFHTLAILKAYFKDKLKFMGTYFPEFPFPHPLYYVACWGIKGLFLPWVLLRTQDNKDLYAVEYWMVTPRRKNEGKEKSQHKVVSLESRH